MIVLFGATGDLGGRVAALLRERAVQFRAVVRPEREIPGDLADEIALARFEDPSSLERAVNGASVVISGVTVISRALAGETTGGFRRVDDRGHRDLVDAAERAGARRFVFVSAAGIQLEPARSSPLGTAKLSVEARLQASSLRETIVRPDMFQDVWLSPVAQFDWPRRKVTVYGRGENAARYVATDDVAEAIVRLALVSNPPRELNFGGPEALTPKQAVACFERTVGEGFRVRHVPRPALRAGARALRGIRPALATLMALSLSADLHPITWDDGPLRALGIEPRSVDAYVKKVVGT